MQWALLCRQLQTVHRAAHSPPSPRLSFLPQWCLKCLSGVKNECIRFPGQRVGQPWGALAFQIPQEGVAADHLHQAGASQPEVSWHTLGIPEWAAGQYVKRVKKAQQ